MTSAIVNKFVKKGDKGPNAKNLQFVLVSEI